MEKTLTTIGNSKAVILPSSWIKKYNFQDEVSLIEMEDGILVKPAGVKSRLQSKIEEVRKNKAAIYQKMEQEANEAATVAFYEDPLNTTEDLDLDVL